MFSLVYIKERRNLILVKTKNFNYISYSRNSHSYMLLLILMMMMMFLLLLLLLCQTRKKYSKKRDSKLFTYHSCRQCSMCFYCKNYVSHVYLFLRNLLFNIVIITMIGTATTTETKIIINIDIGRLYLRRLELASSLWGL